MKKLQIAVVGSAGWEEYSSSKPDKQMFKAAQQVGQLLGEKGCVVVNGGKGGVMEAVCKGAKRSGGLTVAEISGSERFGSNSYVDVEVVTGDVAFRGPSQLVVMSDAVIAIGGGVGTLQEICVAYRLAKPIVLLKGYGGWTDRLSERQWLDERKLIKFLVVTTAEDAVTAALNLVQSRQDLKQ